MFIRFVKSDDPNRKEGNGKLSAADGQRSVRPLGKASGHQLVTLTNAQSTLLGLDVCEELLTHDRISRQSTPSLLLVASSWNKANTH